jgi:uncharacterized caspase-like protein
MGDEVTGSSQEEQAGKRLAVVVGVNGQPAPGRAPLRYAVEDVEACGFEVFVPPLLGEQTAIKDTIWDLAESLSEEDRAYFYLSGHDLGMPIEADLDEVYLVRYDFKPKQIRRDKDVLHSFLVANQFQMIVKEMIETARENLIVGPGQAGFLDEVSQNRSAAC